MGAVRFTDGGRKRRLARVCSDEARGLNIWKELGPSLVVKVFDSNIWMLCGGLARTPKEEEEIQDM